MKENPDNSKFPQQENVDAGNPMLISAFHTLSQHLANLQKKLDQAELSLKQKEEENKALTEKCKIFDKVRLDLKQKEEENKELGERNYQWSKVIKFLVTKQTMKVTENLSQIKGMPGGYISPDSIHDILETFLENGADINGKDKNGMTPLFFACKFKLEGLVSKLVNDQKYKINFEIKDNQLYNLLFWGLEIPNPRLLEEILKKPGNRYQ